MLQLIAVVWLLITGWVAETLHAQSLRISYSGVAGQNLAIWVTYEAGLFKKYGLNPEMLMIAGGVTNIQALLAGEIAFGHLYKLAPVGRRT